MEQITNEIGMAVDQDTIQDGGTAFHSKDGKTEDEGLPQRQEVGGPEVLHSSKRLFEIPPDDWDHRCHCCMRHMSEITPFGGPGDPLLGDHTGALLVKQCRPLFKDSEEDRAILEAEKSHEKDGFKDEREWLLERYGEERTNEIYDKTTLGYIAEPLLCRDCAGLGNDKYFARQEAAEKLRSIPSSDKQFSNPPSFPLERVLPMYEIKFIDAVLDHENVLSLLSELGMNGISQVTRIGNKLHRYNRKSVKYEYTTEQDSGRKKIVMDITGTEPSPEQVQNVVYEFGADCDERIIVFADFGKKFEGSKWNKGDMETLVSMMNDFGLRITFVRAIIDERYFQYKVVVAPPEWPKSDISRCPSKEIFSAVNFWEFYYWPEGDTWNNKPFSIGFSEEYGCFTRTSGDRDIILKWGEQGAILSFIGLDESDEYVQAFWSKRKKELRTACHGSDVEYIAVIGEKPKISIRLLESPVSILTVASVEEKTAYADLLRARFDRINLLIQRFITDLESEGLKESDFDRSKSSDLVQ